MCRAEHEPDGPRRCPGDMRLGYARAARGGKRLERAEAALVSELADLDGANGAASPDVSSPWSLQRAFQPLGLTFTAMRTPQVAQKWGGSYSHRQPGQSATGRPQPSQKAAAAPAC